MSRTDNGQPREIVLLDEWHAGTYGIPDAKTIAHLGGQPAPNGYGGGPVEVLPFAARGTDDHPAAKEATQADRGAQRLDANEEHVWLRPCMLRIASAYSDAGIVDTSGTDDDDASTG